MATADRTDRGQFSCPVESLTPGDLVRTPARCWETVTALDSGDAFTRSTRVITAESGPDYPWVWPNGHTVTARRPVRQAAGRSNVVPLIPGPVSASRAARRAA